MEYFVERGKELFGEKYATINVQLLIHIVDDYHKWGVLDNSSVFVYENFLGILKRRVR